MSEPEIRNLHDIPAAELPAALAPLVDAPFRARQVARWLHDRGAASIDEMTDLSLGMRESLSTRFTASLPGIEQRTDPAPDGSEKFLFRLADGSKIEAVYMPMGERTTICLSSQAGCAVGCTFCVTGFFGAGRNLTPAEITGQVHRIRREREIPWERLNLVLMGMGEPLLNLENVIPALDSLYPNVAPRRITLSTSGIIPGIEELGRLERRPNLAVSINAPDGRRREEIMPITKKYPLPDLIESLRRYPLEKGREITAEYVLLQGWNDSPRDAETLARLLRGLRVKVNAIPFNPDPNLPAWMKRPSDAAIDRFAAALAENRIPVTVRRSRGDQIAAACGQLRGKNESKVRGERDPKSL
ncbi:MAG TPA: 23S rRNA (adenine(2503)-C(2))-methyltransferase RlmN [Thermoanaerobaculia bacterium]|nr:23S rRNA (adenine(2503)-C(2))-methyltransferase RlmN [Thermoanaerobaculia bacterium]